MKKIKKDLISTKTSSFQHIPKHYLGQNFLISPTITDKIINSCELKEEETVLEIGAGTGCLTDHIRKKVSKVIAIEKDKNLSLELDKKFQDTNVRIITDDFLKFNLKSLPKNIKVIGNLPYYISTPIITKVLENHEHFQSLFITVQLEFGQRLVAKPNTKEYGSFSCFVQYYTEPKILFRIRNTAFKPQPKVHSCFLKLEIRKKPLYQAKDEKILFKLIRGAFQQRRKVLVNAMVPLIKKEKILSELTRLNINPKARAENLTLKNYVDLANILVMN